MNDFLIDCFDNSL